MPSTMNPKTSPEESSQDLPYRLPEMVLIPTGSFIMGTTDEQIQVLLEKEDWAQEWFDKDLFHIEQPSHPAMLPDYEIARFPVTNAEYYVFVYNTSYKVPKHWIGFKFAEGMENHPVVQISKADADAYIHWLNQQSRSNFRLPTEVEWEKAARSAELRIFPWGDSFDPWRCNTVESGKKQTTPVGSYSPGGDSVYGISDMVGNVWEWTSSYLIPYQSKPDDAAAKTKIVVRGGAWYYSRALARCASREGVLQDYTSPALGFRLARSR